MACGTPVIAYRFGSVPEVVEDGITGFIVDGRRRRSKRLRKSSAWIEELSAFEERFVASRMAREYEDLYRELVARR